MTETNGAYDWLHNLKGCRGKPRNAWCGPGWREIVETCDADLDYITEGTYVIDQIKEKFGTLRFYWHIEPYNYDKREELHRERLHRIGRAVVRDAEALSAYRCENCGQHKYTDKNNPVTTEGSWLKTLCQSCRDASKANRT